VRSFCGEGPCHKIAFKFPVPKNVPGNTPVVLLLVAFMLYIEQVNAVNESAMAGLGGRVFWYKVTNVLLVHKLPASRIVNV
jgi:hypothetical protein